MRWRVAALSVTTEQIPRPTTASVSSGSSGRRSRPRPARSSRRSGVWIAADGPIRVLALGGLIRSSEGSRSGGSKRLRRSRDEALGLAEPLRGDQPRDGRRGFRSEAALLDRHRDHDRPRRIGEVAHVPGLVFLAHVFGRARLPVHRMPQLLTRRRRSQASSSAATFARHAAFGTRPVISVGRSIPVCAPTPSSFAMFWMTEPWLLASSPVSKKYVSEDTFSASTSPTAP